MKKLTFVINGAGGVGKDTLCDLAAKHFRVYNISTIMPIKDIARMCGWAGEKTDKARRFLSDLKALTVEYNDYPTVWATERYRGFLESEDEIMFLSIPSRVCGTQAHPRTSIPSSTSPSTTPSVRLPRAVLSVQVLRLLPRSL